MKLEYTVISNKYNNIKEVLKGHFNISNRLLLKLKQNQKILKNDEPSNINSSIKENDKITVIIDFDENSDNIVPTQMPLEIVFEDECMLVLNKPAGLPVHPSILHFEDSLSNGVKAYFEKNQINCKIRPVNRLDKDTSGLVIFAKNQYIQECLIKQMETHEFQKSYLAFLAGNLEKNSGVINAPIARKENSIIEREINPNGQNAITEYKLIKNFKNYCLVEFTLKTGRTHQIRVHSKHIGHPILGDWLYGSTSNLISHQALHAYKISFIHPVTKKAMVFEIPLPNDMQVLIN